MLRVRPYVKFAQVDWVCAYKKLRLKDCKSLNIACRVMFRSLFKIRQK